MKKLLTAALALFAGAALFSSAPVEARRHCHSGFSFGFASTIMQPAPVVVETYYPVDPYGYAYPPPPPPPAYIAAPVYRQVYYPQPRPAPRVVPSIGFSFGFFR